MTKQAWVELVNATIQNERNALARSVSAVAALRDGKVVYFDNDAGYTRRVTFAQIMSHLHGADIRALKAARA